jgi:two-component sensor histidine kinase
MMEHLEDQAPGSEGPRSGAEPLRQPSAEALGLLHEVDHRVKNNLQLIASLIQLQARRTADPSAQQALKTVLERVNAVATVHRRLFQGDVQRFAAADFLRDLCGDLAAAAGRNDIEFALDLERVELPAASAAPFALIANELIGNALKHAFAPGRRGRITVTLAEEAGTCVLTVADDGAGLSDAPPGFGLALVRLLCQQLHADLDLAQGPGPGARMVLRTSLTRNFA